MVVHSLNALRVIAEFVVARGHIALDVASPDLLAKATFADVTSHDLMTFFFVLSGYVSMHHADRLGLRFDTWAEVRAYWGNKILRYYPIYLFAILVQHIMQGAYQSLYQQATCGWRWVCTLGDYCLLSPFFFCEVVGTSGAMWYISTLFWLWFAFPFMPKRMVHDRVWRRLFQLYSLSLLGWVPGLWIRGVSLRIPWASLHRFPLLRVAEFFMGGQLFHAEPPTRRLLLSLVALYASYVFFGAFASGWYTHCTTAPVVGPCYPYGQVSGKFDYTCFHWWDLVHSRASLPFAALIRYVAFLDATRCPSVAWLQHDIFMQFNKFSLHLYLLHQNMGIAIWFVCKHLGLDGTILLDGVIVLTYLVGYLTYLYVQPVLNQLTRAALEGACCCRRRPELEDELPAPPPAPTPDDADLDVEMVDLNPPPLWPEVGKTHHHHQVIIGGAPPPLVLTPRSYP